MTTTGERRADPLDPLRTHRLESGYHGVYRKTRGDGANAMPSWAAKPWRKRYLSTHPTPKDAARAVAAWWRAKFGDDWPRVFRSRHTRPWDTIKDRKGGLVIDPRGFLVKAETGYRLVVRVHGRARTVPPPDARAVLFHSKQQATAHYRLWACERYGLLTPLIVRGA